jgi:CheY-like chemotaxis protein
LADEILIVDNTDAVAGVLREILTDEGCDARSHVAPADQAVAAVRDHRPDALLLGLPPRDDAAADALDALRTDPVAREVPVLTLATAPRINAAARASYTVQETIDEPFELEELVDKVFRTLTQPPIQALVGEGTSEGILGQAEPLVARHARSLLLAWADDRRREEPWSSQPAASVADVLGDTPVLVDAIDASLRTAEPAALFDDPVVAERIVRRAADRRAQGVPEPAALAEVTAVRDDLWSMLLRHLPSDLPEADTGRLREALDGAVERILALTLPAYGDEPAARPAAG